MRTCDRAPSQERACVLFSSRFARVVEPSRRSWALAACSLIACLRADEHRRAGRAIKSGNGLHSRAACSRPRPAVRCRTSSTIRQTAESAPTVVEVEASRVAAHPSRSKIGIKIQRGAQVEGLDDAAFVAYLHRLQTRCAGARPANRPTAGIAMCLRSQNAPDVAVTCTPRRRHYSDAITFRTIIEPTRLRQHYGMYPARGRMLNAAGSEIRAPVLAFCGWRGSASALEELE